MSSDKILFKPASDPETIAQGLEEGWIVPSSRETLSFPPKNFAGDCTIVHTNIHSNGMKVEVLKPLSPMEARTVCDEIKRCFGSARQLLLVLWEGEGWRALGYSSWRECVTQEFEQSQRHCYHLLAAAQVGRNLCTIVQNPDDIPESHLRPLAKLEPEYQVQAYQEALSEVGENGRLTGDKVKKVVNRYLASKMPDDSGRRANDYYPTDQRLTQAFLALMADKINLDGKTIIEPCVGSGDIVACLPLTCKVITNDINPDHKADYHLDATKPEIWTARLPYCKVVITNPPFDGAIDILRNAIAHASEMVIFLLRISFSEPCGNRHDFLKEYADNLRYFIPVNPRPHFRGDGKGDNATVAWFVWDKTWSWEQAGYPSPFQFLTNWRTGS